MQTLRGFGPLAALGVTRASLGVTPASIGMTTVVIE
jgi:hypothetical protein